MQLPNDLKAIHYLLHMLQYSPMESKKSIRITTRHELIAVISVVGLLGISLVAPWIVPRVILGFPFVLFLPGYSLLSALFPKKGQLELLERFVISAGFSLVIVSLITFTINFTPWGLHLLPLFWAFSSFILGSSLISYYRRSHLPEAERFEIKMPLKIPIWAGTNHWSKALSIVLIASILIAVGSIGFVLAKPKPGEKFTELYLLGAQGKAADYPQTITMGETTAVTVGIVNREQKAIPYLLEVVIGGTLTFTINHILLDNAQKWEDAVPLSPVKSGKQQKVEINLYRPGDTQPYRFLILWVDVLEK